MPVPQVSAHLPKGIISRSTFAAVPSALVGGGGVGSGAGAGEGGGRVEEVYSTAVAAAVRMLLLSEM